MGTCSVAQANNLLKAWTEAVWESNGKGMPLVAPAGPHAIWFEGFSVPASGLGTAVAGGVTFTLRTQSNQYCEMVANTPDAASGLDGKAIGQGAFVMAMERCKDVLVDLQGVTGPAGEAVFGPRVSVSALVTGTGAMLVLRVVQQVALQGWTDPATGGPRDMAIDVVLDEKNMHSHPLSIGTWAGAGLGTTIRCEGIATIAASLSTSHELAGIDANRAAIEVVAVDVDSPAWRALFPAMPGLSDVAGDAFLPLRPSGTSRLLPVALRVRGAPVNVPVLSNDGSSIPLPVTPTYMVPLATGVKDPRASVMLESVSVPAGAGGGSVTGMTWTRVKQDQDTAEERLAERDAVAGEMAAAVMAACAEGLPTGSAMATAGSAAYQTAWTLASGKKGVEHQLKVLGRVACQHAFPVLPAGGLVEAQLYRDASTGTITVFHSIEDGAPVIGTKYYPLAQYGSVSPENPAFKRRVPVVALNDDNPLACTHATDLQSCQWQPMTYEQWIRWHFDSPPGETPKKDEEFEPYRKLAYNFICFLRGAWPRGSRFSVNLAEYYGL